MGRRRLLDDLTIAEMKRLRDHEDLSNAEVAKRLDVSAVTVWKYLGAKRTKQSTQPEPKRNEPNGSKPIWEEARSLNRLRAGERVYDLDVFNQTVVLRRGSQWISMGPDVVHSMINELTYIEQVMKKWREEHQ